MDSRSSPILADRDLIAARANELLLLANGGQEGNGSGPVRQGPKDANCEFVTDVDTG